MKVTLTENQVLVLTKRIVEDVTNALDPTSLSSLEKFVQLYQDPEKALIDRLGPEKAMELIGKIAELGINIENIGNNSSKFAKDIPEGEGLMNLLGHRSKISSGFGLRNMTRGSKNHKGVDLSTPSGSPVYAPQSGRVMFAGDTTPNGCGGFIELDHGSMITKFCHLRQWVVNKGNEVKKGQLIGYSGGAPSDPYRGTSTGAHLHYEILNSSGTAMNPTTVQNNLV